MKALTGTEKQVAWAEEIRGRYETVAQLLIEYGDMLADETQIETTVSDPLGGGTATHRDYARKMTPTQDAARSAAEPFYPEGARGNAVNYHEYIMAMAQVKYDEPHAERRAKRRFVLEVVENLADALATRDSAKYWIGRRWQ